MEASNVESFQNKKPPFIDFESILDGAQTYDEFEQRVKATLDEVRKKNIKLGFVSGPLEYSDPPTVERMKTTTKDLQSKFKEDNSDNPYVFSSLDIFKGKAWDVWKSLNLSEAERPKKMKQLCDEVVSRVNDLYMLLDWHKADGSALEFKKAIEHGGINIHFLAPLLSPEESKDFLQKYGVRAI